MPAEKRLETFHISTYGCQMNLADSSTLGMVLVSRGYKRVADEEDADLVVLNTCSVRERAEERIFGRLGELYNLKRRKPDMKIAVVGCMAQRLGKDLIRQVPHVDYVLGTDRLFELPDVIEGIEGTRTVMTAFGHENIDGIQPIRENEFSGFVTISRGCDNYCTYCIVPYVRGREVSHSTQHIVDAVQQMTAEGVVEVTLLGQNVNSYRYGEVDFPQLLRIVARETDIPRLRFMTSHPKDFSEALVDVLAGEPKIMPHIHLPLQSGSNAVLEKMGRKYSYEHYLKIIECIRSRLDDVSITTDLMVGFPSETVDDYEQTLAAVRQIRYDSAYMYRYSVRPGTSAAGCVDDVSEDEKIRRLTRLIEIQQNISTEENQREIGRVRFGVVEGYSRRSREFARARTENNKIVLFRTDRLELGAVVPVRIKAADAFTLHGDLVEAD